MASVSTSSPANPRAHPVAILRDLTTALEAAMTVCLADPDIKSVHALRAIIRRIHAQMDLQLSLQTLSQSPKLPKVSEKALRRLDRLGSFAGKVRDLDVQRAMLDDLAKSSAPHGPQDLDHLNRRLRKRRKLAAAKLQKQIQKHIALIARGLEALVDTLKPVPDLELPVREALATIDANFAAACQTSAGARSSDPEDQLHNLRKAAKTARYQAESIPNSTLAARSAARYQRIQNFGGLWHDRLTFAALLAGDLKPGHKLITLSNRNAATARRAYERLLARMLAKHSFTPQPPAA